MALSEGGKYFAYTGKNQLMKIIRIRKKKCEPFKLIKVLEEV